MRLACSVFALVCATAVQARADFVISADATKNVNCSGATCTATARNAILNVQDLEGRLASSSVTLASGGGAQDIDFAAPVSWTSANGLTVNAQRSIKIDRPLLVAGDGALTLQINDGGNGGDLWIRPHGNIGFLGTGNALTINDKPYVLVNSIAALASSIATDPRGHLALANDYDASVDGTYAKSPVRVFRGTFEGLGHTISGLAISDPKPLSPVGLFGATTAATIRDLKLVKARLNGASSSLVGALVGFNDGAQVTNVDVSAVVSGGQFGFVGGLVGFNRRGQVGKHFVYGSIVRSRASGQVTGGNKAFVGGLAGASTGVILFSSANASVTGGARSFVGGLVGFAIDYVENSFATGAASGGFHSNVGGLVGANLAAITESYALGSATTGDDGRAGGLVGRQSAFTGGIIESYSAGPASGGSGAAIGGSVGYDRSQGKNGTSYWDIDTSGLSQAAGNLQVDPGITGLSDAQFKAGLPPDFDSKDWAEDPNINGGLPYLKQNRPPE